MWDTFWRKVYLDPDDDLWDEPSDDEDEEEDGEGLRWLRMPFFFFCSRRAARAWRRALSTVLYLDFNYRNHRFWALTMIFSAKLQLHYKKYGWIDRPIVL